MCKAPECQAVNTCKSANSVTRLVGRLTIALLKRVRIDRELVHQHVALPAAHELDAAAHEEARVLRPHAKVAQIAAELLSARGALRGARALRLLRLRPAILHGQIHDCPLTELAHGHAAAVVPDADEARLPCMCCYERHHNVARPRVAARCPQRVVDELSKRVGEGVLAAGGEVLPLACMCDPPHAVSHVCLSIVTNYAHGS